MAILNGGTLIIAIPDLMRVLKADLFSALWILIAYQLVQTVLVLTAGRLADMIGRETLYVAGFDALTAGLLLTPMAASMLVASPFSRVLADRYGSRILSIVGLAREEALRPAPFA
jgi:MFS family permease